MNYKTRLLKPEDFKAFEPLYEDFRVRAITDYGFELEPLCYQDFIDSINKNLISCLVLFENDVPSAFLIYTTLISEALELNLIHTLNMENTYIRTKRLMEKFIDLTKDIRKNKVVCYPLLGSQKSLIGEVARFGFKFVGITVLRFMMSGTNSRDIFNMARIRQNPPCYTVEPWDDKYFNDAVRIVNEAFMDSADALFDPRFKTVEGVYDILSKITQNIYAQFLPESTSVLKCDEYPIGFCFTNCSGNIVNIPIVAIKKEHQGRGLSKLMLKHSLDAIISEVKKNPQSFVEINTCTETNNFQALKLYRNLGFKEDYSYPQSYLPIKK